MIVKSAQKMGNILAFIADQHDHRYPIVHFLSRPTTTALSTTPFSNAWELEHISEDRRMHREDALEDLEQIFVRRENDISIGEPQNVVSCRCLFFVALHFVVISRFDVHLVRKVRGWTLRSTTKT